MQDPCPKNLAQRDGGTRGTSLASPPSTTPIGRRDGAGEVALLTTHPTSRITASREELAAIFTNVAMGLATLSADGRFRLANHELGRMTQRPHDELLSIGIAEVVPADDATRMQDALARVVADGDGALIEHRIERPGAEALWVESSLTRFDDQQGRSGVALAVKDISARREIEEALRGAQEWLQFALDAAHMGTWSWDPHRDIVKHDARSLEILGGDADTDFSDAASIEKHLPRENAASYLECVQRIKNPGVREDSFELETSWTRPDGRAIWIQLTGQARFQGEGSERRAAGLHGTILDITERKRNERAIAEANRQKDRFLATLAHELRNPLAPLCYAAELLHGDTQQELEWSRGVIQRQLAHMTRLIDDLLDLSRINRDQLEVRRERIAIGDVIQAAVEASRPMLKQHDQELEVGMPREAIYVSGDFVRLTQVFTNLLTNAAKFTVRPGRVWLAVERQDGEVSVCVRDSGIGIPTESLPQIFDMFYQSNSSLARTHGGLGIGLYLVRRIVELHAGTVEARSGPERQGADFVVRLPVIVESSGHAASGSAVDTTAEARGGGHRVLIVDDNHDSTDVLAALLRARGAHVETAYDGPMALAVAEGFRPDVVLLDLGMPKMDGYEVCHRMRERPWGKSARLVALTGWGRDEDRARSREAGFDEHLVKPVGLATVESLLARIDAK